MQARIYKPSKSAMQSGSKSQSWLLEYIRVVGSEGKDSVMGWRSNTDMNQELKLRFDSLESAKAYAKANHIAFEFITPTPRAVIKKQYSDNFTR